MAIQYAVESVNPLTMQTYHPWGYTGIRNVPGTTYLVRSVPQLCGSFGSMSITSSGWTGRIKVFLQLGTVGTLLYVIRYKSVAKISGREWFFLYQYVLLHFYAGISDDLLCIHHGLSEPGTLPAPSVAPANVLYDKREFKKLSELISIKGRTFPPRWLVNTGVADMLPDHCRRRNRNGWPGTSLYI